MKAILYVVSILVVGGAAYFTLEHSRKFEVVQKSRLQNIATNKEVSANADVKEKELKDAKAELETSKTKREEVTQRIGSLKSNGGQLQRDVAELDSTIAAQDEEFAILEKTLKEVNDILKDLGEDITLDNLPEKIEQIEEDKKARIAKVEELETLVGAAERLLASNRAEVDRLVKRKIARSASIGRNSMEAVVSAVNQDWGFLVIGAGSNSGFSPQTPLIVQRDGRLIGRVVPSLIESTQTIAEIDFKSLAPGVRIQPGDRVILAKPAAN
jgi:predicted  nucleic acid-binding Zn-ribbon protein